jgi:hypothetical protein
MSRPDKQYHTQRAKQERGQAQQSKSDVAAKIHNDMADRHDAEAKKSPAELRPV